MESINKEKKPINLEELKFTITFNTILVEKDKKIENKEKEERLVKYIEAIQKKIEKNIFVINSMFQEDIETGSMNGSEVVELKKEHVLQNMNDNKDDFCNGLNPEYIDNSLTNCNAIISLENNANDIICFATLFFKLPNTINIDVICSNNLYKGGGNAIIDKIVEICKIIHIKFITLSSLTEALGFYTKKQFECDELCDLKLKITGGKWSKKYKKTINCKKPKGFSQKQHCKYGRKTRKNKKVKK